MANNVPIQRKLHGKTVGITEDDAVRAEGGFVAGGGDRAAVYYPSPDTTAFFEDFYLDHDLAADTGNAGHYFIRRTADTGCSGSIVASTNGVYRITMSGTLATNTPAGNVNSIVGPQLMWKANQGKGAAAGRLRFGARIKASTWTMGGVFAGFTDSNAAEMPAYDTGGSLFTVAADAVGFLFGENGDTGFMGVSAKSTAGDSGDQSVALTTSAPTANTYVDLEVEVRRNPGDTGGRAFFYVDGDLQGAIDSPLASATALTPVIAMFDVNSTGAAQLDIDWVAVSAERDTGN